MDTQAKKEEVKVKPPESVVKAEEKDVETVAKDNK